MEGQAVVELMARPGGCVELAAERRRAQPESISEVILRGVAAARVGHCNKNNQGYIASASCTRALARCRAPRRGKARARFSPRDYGKWGTGYTLYVRGRRAARAAEPGCNRLFSRRFYDAGGTTFLLLLLHAFSIVGDCAGALGIISNYE